ncbi:MAG TPA: [LysW]-lysine hydrolase [Phycisphaerales bacterium]|nr:[LysW]-lysine hydrolase [Phycisphaerales bacterium]
MTSSATGAIADINAALNARAIAVVHDLVATPSVSGNEAAAVAVFTRHAREFGFATEVDAAGNGHAIRTASSSHNAPVREIVLLGHIDTVPGDIPVSIEHGVLHGRGSVDAKGPLAAFLVAASRAVLPPNVTLRVVAAVGEETPHSPGARYLAPRLTPAACIIGEPSGTTGVTLGYKGRLVMHVTATRDNAHTAGPDASACDQVLRAWSECERHITSSNVDHVGAFETIQATVRTLRSDSDGLHDTASLVAGFRLPRWISPDALEQQLRSVINASGASVAITFEGHEHAFATDRNDAVVRALSAAIRDVGHRPQPKLKTGTADLNVVAPIWRCPIAAYGPGDSALDHTPREHLVLDEYLLSIRILTQAIESLAAELAAT